MKTLALITAPILIFSTIALADVPVGNWKGQSPDGQACSLLIEKSQDEILICDESDSNDPDLKGSILGILGERFKILSEGKYVPIKTFEKEYFNHSKIEALPSQIVVHQKIFFKNPELGLPDYLNQKLYIHLDAEGQPIGFGQSNKTDQASCYGLVLSH